MAASNAGQPTHPAWYLNPQASPHAQIQVGAAIHNVVARHAAPKERDAQWCRIVAFDPSYAAVQARTNRKIPIVILETRT